MEGININELIAEADLNTVQPFSWRARTLVVVPAVHHIAVS